jgi:hypothetical protein
MNRTQEVVRETFTCRGQDVAELRYFKNCKNKNEHIVVLEYFEEDCPRVSRFATIEEARNRWRELRINLTALGYRRSV